MYVSMSVCPSVIHNPIHMPGMPIARLRVRVRVTLAEAYMLHFSFLFATTTGTAP